MQREGRPSALFDADPRSSCLRQSLWRTLNQDVSLAGLGPRVALDLSAWGMVDGTVTTPSLKSNWGNRRRTSSTSLLLLIVRKLYSPHCSSIQVTDQRQRHCRTDALAHHELGTAALTPVHHFSATKPPHRNESRGPTRATPVFTAQIVETAVLEYTDQLGSITAATLKERATQISQDGRADAPGSVH